MELTLRNHVEQPREEGLPASAGFNRFNILTASYNSASAAKLWAKHKSLSVRIDTEFNFLLYN